MKKIFFTFVIFLSIFQSTNAFFGSADELDMYLNIDKNIEEIEVKNYVIETNGIKNFKEEVNKELIKEKINCSIEKELQRKDIKEIRNGNTKLVINSLNKDCLDEKGNVSIEILNKVTGIITYLDDKNIIRSEEKSSQINKISSLGIYSDGNTENSGFDLLDDINQIDKIIFSDTEEYVGVENHKTDTYFDDFNDLLYDKLTNNKNSSNNSDDQENNLNKNTGGQIQLKEISLSSSYVCSIDNSDSGLDKKNLFFSLNDFKNNEITTVENPVIKLPDIEKNKDIDEKLRLSDYQSISDKGFCDGFFCIDIEFISYQHNLLGGGSSTSIESIVNKSNKHLRKFSATSMDQAEMSINNFELGIKNIDLASMFHMGFIITEKPVPILSLNKKSKSGDDEMFSTKNQLEKYYKYNGLNYNRRNDLSLLTKIQKEKQLILNSGNLAISEALKKDDQLKAILNSKNKEIDLYSKTIQHKASYEIFGNFNEQFIEIEGFTKSINSYVKNVDTIVSNMLKIPSK